jgi:hypothetical protein
MEQGQEKLSQPWENIPLTDKGINQTTDVAGAAYELDYFIEDVAFAEPFQVLKPLRREGFAWWNGQIAGRGKVERLISAFKTDFTIHEACFYAGITLDQYKYFCEVHSVFSTLKPRLKALPAIAAKTALMADLIDPKNHRVRQWYLERTEPEIYGRKDARII